MEYKPKYFFSLKNILEGVFDAVLALYPVLMIIFLPLLFCLYYPNAAVSGSIFFIYAISIIRCLYKLFKYFYMYLKERRSQRADEYYVQTTGEIDEFEYVPEIPGLSKKDFVYLSLFVSLVFTCLFLSKDPPDLLSYELSKNFIGKFLLFVNNMLYNHEILFSICCLAVFTVIGYLGIRFRDMLSSRE